MNTDIRQFRRFMEIFRCALSLACREINNLGQSNAVCLPLGHISEFIQACVFINYVVTFRPSFTPGI